MEKYIAKHIKNVKGSVIRQFAELACHPGMISFANGNPSPNTFSVKDYAKIAAKGLLENPITLLQYGSVMGYAPLIEVLKERLSRKFNIDFQRNELAITTGGTQAGDLISKILINEGEIVISEDPSFASFFNIFRSYGANLVGVPIGAEGICLYKLEEALRANPNAKMIYTIPTFHNPTGYTSSKETREGLYKLAQKYDVIILEDDPYSELRYKGEATKPMKATDPDGRIFYCGTLSKVIAPSFRLGFVVFEKSFTTRMNIAKQITDVHTNLLAQYIAYEYMTNYDFNKHIEECCTIYRNKSSLMLDLLRDKLHPSIKLSNPEGGLFAMMFLPEKYDALKFVLEAADKGVVCVPGIGFKVNQDVPDNSVRLCYSTPTEEEIMRGAKILGELSHKLFN